ncbi:hypothetical protein Tco_1289468 [Tanacetum coccineum]
MGYLVYAYYNISPTKYYKDDSWWNEDLKLKTTEDIISIESFVEVLVLNQCVPVRKILSKAATAKKIGPLEIVEKINSNAYRLKLPSHIRCSDVFNVKHLLPYHGDSSDDDLVVNSRANFVYPGVNNAGPSVEERACLFLEAQDRVKKRHLFKEA